MSACGEMSRVMFIDQYLKRSANLFSENITDWALKNIIMFVFLFTD